MIRRILYAVVGCAAAAVMISAATRAVDFEASSIEDGNTRFVIAAAGAVVFLGCLYLLVVDLAHARSAAASTDGETAEPNAAPNRSSLADRFAAARSTEQMAGSDGPRPSPIVVTQPSAATGAPPDVTADRPTSVTSSGTGLFGVVTPSTRASTADGLFGRRTPNRGTAVDRAEGVPTSPPTVTTAPEPAMPTTPPMGVPMAPPEAASPPATHEAATPVEPTPTAEPVAPPAAVADVTTPPPPTTAAEPIALRDYDPDHRDRTPATHHRPADDALVVSDTRPHDASVTAEDIRAALFAAVRTEERRATLHEARAEEPVPVDRVIETANPHPDVTHRDTAHADVARPDIARADVAHPDDALPQWHVIDDLDDSADEGATGDDIDPEDGVDGDDDPPSTGYLYVTGGN